MVWAARAKRIAAINNATVGDQYFLTVFKREIDMLKCMFWEECPLSRLKPRVHIDDRPDYTLICAQADYLAERLARTSCERERRFLTNVARLAEHRPSAAAAAYNLTVPAPGQSLEELEKANRQSEERG